MDSYKKSIGKKTPSRNPSSDGGIGKKTPSRNPSSDGGRKSPSRSASSDGGIKASLSDGKKATASAAKRPGTAFDLTGMGNVMRKTAMAPMVAGKNIFNVVGQGIGETTKVVTASANTVVSGTKAVVDGTIDAVDYSGKAVYSGTKGVVKGITYGTANLIGFAPRSTDGQKSKWEQGVETIESLLEPGSATYQAMTPEQRKQLLSVKKLLITGPGGDNKTAHIPRDLIKLKSNVNGQKGGAVERRLSSNFILQEFAGVKDPSLFGEGMDLDDVSEGDSDAEEDDPVSTPTPKAELNKSMTKRFSIQGIGQDESLAFLKSLDSLDEEYDDVVSFVPAEFKAMSKENKIAVFNLLSWDSIKKWDFNIFELSAVTNGQPLLFMGWAILGSPYAQTAMAADIGMDDTDANEGYPFMFSLMIPPKKLCEYLRVIEADYRANPYHNSIHAADVLQSLHVLIQSSLDEDFLQGCPDIHLFTILLAAVIHDVDHPGKTNAFHTQMRTELAVMYNDRSVLENWHAAHAFAKMLDLDLTGSNIIHASQVVAARKNEYTKDCPTNILCNASPEHFKTIRNLLIEAVLHTDMTKHFEMVNSAKGLLRQEINEDNMWKALMFMLHMADISGQAKGDPLFKLWTTRCMDEFFAQGDEEVALGLPISPNCDRKTTDPAGSQVGFIKFVIEPAYEVLGMFIPFVKSEVVPQVHSNLEHWVRAMNAGEEDSGAKQ